MKEKTDRAGFTFKHTLIFHIFLVMIAGNIISFDISAENKYKDEASKKETYYNKKLGFFMGFPSDWEVQRNLKEEGVLITFLALSPLEGEDDTYHDLVMVSVPKRKTRLPGGKDFEDLPEAERKAHLKDFSEGFLRGLSSDGDEFKIKKHGFDEIDKIMTRWIIASGRMGKFEITTLAYFFYADKRAYTISCMAETRDFERYKKIFEETAKTFKFEADKGNRGK